jgi:uncharacterized protein (DUF433 family)
MNKPKLSRSGVPVIPMNEVMSWEDWLKGRRARRETGNKVAPEIIRRPSSSSDRIVIDPGICHGKPVIRGTRMPVSLIVGSLASGMSFEEIERECSLTRDDIRAALKFASELVDQEQHHPLALAK